MTNTLRHIHFLQYEAPFEDERCLTFREKDADALRNYYTTANNTDTLPHVAYRQEMDKFIEMLDVLGIEYDTYPVSTARTYDSVEVDASSQFFEKYGNI